MTWKKATWTPLTLQAVSTNFTEVIVPELDGATEIVGYIGNSTNMFPLYLNMCGSAQNIVCEYDPRVTSQENYAYCLAFRYDRINKKVGFRQTMKGTDASLQTLQEIWYR